MKKTYFFLTLLIFTFNAFTQFSDQIPITDGSFGANIQIDFDGDGDLDIFYSDDDAIRWRENSGDLSFKKIHTIYREEIDEFLGLSAIPFDVDADGDWDVAAIDFIEESVVWFENESGEFGEREILFDDIGAFRLYAEDVDEDGDSDLILHQKGDVILNVLFIENLGGLEFEDSEIITTTSSFGSHFSELVDMDGDGDLDVVTTMKWEEKIVWNANLGGTFGPDQIISTGISHLVKTVSFDADGDGDIDIASCSSGGDEVFWFENTGGEVFGPKIVIDGIINSPLRLVAEDIDGDSDKELFCSTFELFCYYPNLGGGLFGDRVDVYTGGFPNGPDVMDLDSDGDNDILFTLNSGSGITFYDNLGGGVLDDAQDITGMTNLIRSVDMADMDLDGDLDLVTAQIEQHAISWFENQEGTFEEIHEVYNVIDLINYFLLEIADMDGDGDLDILSGEYVGDYIQYHENLGSGVFAASSTIAESLPFMKAFKVEDLNGDGNKDLAAIISGFELAWYPGNGDGTFDDQIIIDPLMNNPDEICLTDLDGDGDVDVLTTSSFMEELFWFENDGLGGFAPRELINNEAGLKALRAFDYDEDGDQDILAISGNGISAGLVHIENLGSEVFAPEELLLNAAGIIDYVFTDLDTDGDEDLIFGINGFGGFEDDSLFEIEDEIMWSEFNGSVFLEPTSISHEMQGLLDITLGDLDEDGDLDLASASISDGKIAWYESFLAAERQIKGTVFFDENENGIQDIGEEGLSLVQVGLDPEGSYAYSTGEGNFVFNLDEIDITYEVSLEELEDWDITTTPEVHDVFVDDAFTTFEEAHFGLYPNTVDYEIEADLSGGFPRCNQIVNYWITTENIGSAITSGEIQLELDPDLTYISASVEPESIVGDIYTWNYEDLFYFSDEVILVQVEMPDFEFMGEVMSSTLTTTALDDADLVAFTATSLLEQTVVCAYDPNDKTVTPAGTGDFGNIPLDTEYLEYMVRFQNTGTDTAFTVVIKDQLDENLDWSSLDVLGYSHDMEVFIEPLGEVSFSFENIMLPDSNVNELASHGYVKYRIALLPDLPLGTSIFNTANIYFDANPAIVTNTTINTLAEDNSGIDEEEVKTMMVYPNPFTGSTTVYLSENSSASYTVQIVDFLGHSVYFKEGFTGNQFEIDGSSLKSGIYLLSVTEGNSSEIISTVKLIVR